MRALIPILALCLLASGCMVGQKPSAPDADTDGLPDVVENEGWNITVTSTQFACPDGTPQHDNVTEVHVGSNFLREDSDADGVNDFNEFYYHSDPNATDTDHDGLPDGEEWELRHDPSFFAGTLIALNRTDSDKDCLSDFQEVRGLDIPGLGLRTSDPTVPDTDHDGFSDPWEFQKSHTDPRKTDTDGDGATDQFDADPLHDLWMNFTLDALTVKKLPDDATSGHVQLLWSVPAKDATKQTGHTRVLPVTTNADAPLSGSDSPGTFDMNDATGRPTVQVSLSAYETDDKGRATGILDINPFQARATLVLQIDVQTGQWSFQKADGSFGPAGTTRTLETDMARLSFTPKILASAP